jgi:hypothetical protein
MVNAQQPLPAIASKDSIKLQADQIDRDTLGSADLGTAHLARLILTAILG